MTLQEYLIKLGFSTDEPSFKKFVAAVSHAGGVASELGATAIETATAVEFMVARISRQYESLYYLSQRSGQSISHLKAMQYAFGQIGLTADDATSAIEGMSATLRTQPWLAMLARGAKTPTELVKNLSQSGLPYFLQAQFAGMLGVPEQTYFQLYANRGEEAKQEADLARRLQDAGLTPERLKQMAEQGHAFNVTFRQTESELDIIGDQIYSKLVGPMTAATKAAEGFLERVASGNASTGDWLGAGLALGGTGIGTYLITRLIKKLFRVLVPGKNEIKAAVKEAMGGTEAEAGTAVEAAVGGGLGLRGLLLKGGVYGTVFAAWEAMINDKDHSLRTSLRAALGIDDPNEPAPWEAGGSWKSVPGTAPKVTQGSANRLAQAEQFFTSHGFPPEAAKGIAAALFFESGKTLSTTAFNPAGGGRGAIGIGQWRGERIDQFRKLFGKDLNQATLEEQLQYVLWEMTQGKDAGALQAGNLLHKPGIKAGAAAGTFLNLFERPGPGGAQEIKDASGFADALSRLAAQQQAGASTNVHINQKTDIHVGAGSGASDTANAVFKGQDDVNGNLVRNTVGAIR
jgi:hypothetical protein